MTSSSESYNIVFKTTCHQYHIILRTGEMSTSIFLNYLDFQIVEFNTVHEIVLCEPGLSQAFEIRYGLVQPDGPGEVELIAHLIQRPKDLVGAGVGTAVGYAGILKHAVILKSPCP